MLLAWQTHHICFNPQRGGYKLNGVWDETKSCYTKEFQSPKGRLQTNGILKGGILACNGFQSPKGRLQTDLLCLFVLTNVVSIPKGEATNLSRRFPLPTCKMCFNPQRGGYKHCLASSSVNLSFGFNPQRGGYKHVQELGFIISRLYTPVNVFILKHL